MKKVILFLMVLITINFIFISAESCNNTDECSVEENNSLNDENIPVNAKIIQTVDEDGSINLNLEIEEEKNETEDASSGITGAVIGFMKSSAGKGFAVVALMLVAGMGFMILRKKRKSKSENISKEINKKTLKQ